MAGSPRIDELKKKFDENPVRYFAPLANEYRKAGEIEQAIEICRTYLAEKPGHMSGLIVFGQALYEAKKYDEARGTFEQALALDPENLIALRYLGDIARDSGDIPGARRWYQRVLDADPRNDEIAEQMAGLVDLPATAPAAPEASAATAAESGALGWGDINPESGEQPAHPSPPAPPAPSAPPQAPAAPSPAPLGGAPTPLPHSVSPDAKTLVIEPVQRPPAASPPPPPPAPPPAPLDAVAARPEPSEPETPRAISAPSDSGIERAQEFDGGLQSAAQPPASGFDLHPEFVTPPPAAGSSPPGLETMEFTPPSSSPPQDESLEVLEFAAPRGENVPPRAPDLEAMEFVPPKELHAPPPPAGTPAPGEGEAFVTETMAELYLQQGYRDDALAVYRQLLRQNPTDPDLQARVRQLESGGRSSMPVAEISEDVIHAAQERHASHAQPTARVFFSRIAGWRPPMQSADATATSVATEEPPAPAATEPEAYSPPPPPPPPLPLPPQHASPADEAFGDSAGGWPSAAPVDAGSSEPAFGVGPVTPAEPQWAVEPVTAGAQPEPIMEGDSGPSESSVAAPPGAESGAVGTLFGGAGVPSTDQDAAAMLAHAYATSPPPPPPAPGPDGQGGPVKPTPAGDFGGRPTHKAESELSLDSVFGGTPPRSAGVRTSAGISFDQFFSDNAAGRTRPSPPAGAETEGAGESPPPGPPETDEDVAQFTAWLEGLKKK